MEITNVRAIVYNPKRDNVLLIERNNNGREYYATPGGFLEKGEGIVDGLIREIEEETNQKVKVGKQVYYDEFKGVGHGYFLCNIIEEKPLELTGEEKNFTDENNYWIPRWVGIGELPEVNLLPVEIKELILRDYGNN